VALLTRQADMAQDILDLPNLLSAAIASASNVGAAATCGSGANYPQAPDLFAHIKRLQIVYLDSRLVKAAVSALNSTNGMVYGLYYYNDNDIEPDITISGIRGNDISL